jgi:hypothetical protein
VAINGNPKDAIGSLKATLGAIPRRVLFELGLAFLEGDTKYFRHNYLASPVRAMVYVEALDRHVAAWVEGEDEDPDTCDKDEAGVPIPGTGVSHLMKAGACLLIIRAAQVYGTLIDDRPPAQARGWLEGLNKIARRIIERNGALYERGAYTEANRAEWPAMNDRLAKGPIKKGHREDGKSDVNDPAVVFGYACPWCGGNLNTPDVSLHECEGLKAARAHAAKVYTRGPTVMVDLTYARGPVCGICNMAPCACGDPEGYRGSDY